MIEPLIQLGQWINATDHAAVLVIAPVAGVLLGGRAGWAGVLIWFCAAWWFV